MVSRTVAWVWELQVGCSSPSKQYILVIIGLVVMSTICLHCMHMLVDSSQELCRRTNLPFLTYSDVAETCFSTSSILRLRTFSKVARLMTDVFLCIVQLGFCCAYFVFVSQNLQQVCYKLHLLTQSVFTLVTFMFRFLVITMERLTTGFTWPSFSLLFYPFAVSGTSSTSRPSQCWQMPSSL